MQYLFDSFYLALIDFVALQDLTPLPLLLPLATKLMTKHPRHAEEIKTDNKNKTLSEKYLHWKDWQDALLNE